MYVLIGQWSDVCNIHMVGIDCLYASHLLLECLPLKNWIQAIRKIIGMVNGITHNPLAMPFGFQMA
jgi:hypothetical protein